MAWQCGADVLQLSSRCLCTWTVPYTVRKLRCRAGDSKKGRQSCAEQVRGEPKSLYGQSHMQRRAPLIALHPRGRGNSATRWPQSLQLDSFRCIMVPSDAWSAWNCSWSAESGRRKRQERRKQEPKRSTASTKTCIKLFLRKSLCLTFNNDYSPLQQKILNIAIWSYRKRLITTEKCSVETTSHVKLIPGQMLFLTVNCNWWSVYRRHWCLTVNQCWHPRRAV